MSEVELAGGDDEIEPARAPDLPSPRPERRPGAWAGTVRYHNDIVGPDEDVNAMFSEPAAGETT